MVSRLPMALLRQLAGLVLLLLLVLVPLTPASGAQPYELVVVEHLRLKVPEAGVDAWLAAERGSWEPWLAQQPGFLDRQLLWDAEREEGTLLIHWASREQWMAIPSTQVQAVQQRFEALARQASGLSQGNPFPLIFEGELAPL
ncbi:TIGR03792 family protein [Synechococcus sp. JJ3a-Johnson]|uniref:TIGR03792 family protein n=2 Tax=unclassified Synechococcus TaxID=2626047 RepID=UPI0037D9E147